MSDEQPDRVTRRRTFLKGALGVTGVGVLGRFGLEYAQGKGAAAGSPAAVTRPASEGIEWSRRYVPPGVEETETPPGSQETLLVRSVVSVPDGGFALAGNQRHVDGEGRDFYLLKTDAEGRLEWHERYGGDRYDMPQHLIRTADGGYLLVGVNGQAVAGTPEEGGTPMDTRFRAWAVKTSADGTREWATTPTDAESVANDVVQTAGGGYVLAGGVVTGDDETTAWAAWLDENGTVVDQRTYGDTETTSVFEAVVATGDGGTVFAGERGKGAMVVATDATGEPRWQTTRPYPIGSAADVLRTDDGQYLLTGRHHQPEQTATATSSPEHTDTRSNAAVYLSLLDATGAEQWTRTYSDGGSEAGRSVVQTVDGGFAVAGTSTYHDGDLVVAQIAADGTEQWIETYDSVPGTGHDIEPVDGDYVVTTGETFTKVLGDQAAEPSATETSTASETSTESGTPTAEDATASETASPTGESTATETSGAGGDCRI